MGREAVAGRDASGFANASNQTRASLQFLYKNLPANHAQSKNGQPVLLLSGSSMAAGVTSGGVALIPEQHNQNGLNRQKALTANLVKAMLQFSAVPVADADYLTQGTGEINAAGTIALANVIWGTSDDDNIIWGTSDNIIWGTAGIF